MKGAALFIAIFALSLLIIPMIAMSFDTALPDQPKPDTQTHPPATPIPDAASSASQADRPDMQESVPETSEEEPPPAPAIQTSRYGLTHFSILDESTGEVVSVPIQDFIRGAVAAEMPANFHPEALKAQAVAAHTYALRSHILQLQNPDPQLKGADFAADPDRMLVYATEEKAREFYGDNADLYWNKICQAADSVAPYILEYEDEPILAAYHAISAGQTEDAENVWIGHAPYLLPADSEGDLLAPSYESEAVFSREQMREILQTAYPEAELSGEPDNWLDGYVLSSSGYVLTVDVGGVTVPGKDIRTLLDLRSHNFQATYEGDGQFHFTVLGYGHGVGLSQYGADFLARQGYTFDQILDRYYTGVTLKQATQAS